MDYKIILVNPHDIKITEEIIVENFQMVKAKIMQDGVWTTPLVVEKDSLVLMDGHHRLATAKALGLSYVPAVAISYDEVIVETRRPDVVINSDIIVQRGLSNNPFPPKTTRHIFKKDYQCFVPLEELKTPEKVYA